VRIEEHGYSKKRTGMLRVEEVSDLEFKWFPTYRRRRYEAKPRLEARASIIPWRHMERGGNQMNKDVNQRFAISCEIVFTTQGEMDEFDAQRYFELELSEHWEAMHDLDFESVPTRDVVELPADSDEYEDFKREKTL
jgi:hypothetical protein